MLLRAGANPYAQMLTTDGHSKLTCLHAAILKRNVDVVNCILSLKGKNCEMHVF